VKIAHFFIERPVFAAVLSIVMIIAGALFDPGAAGVPVPGDRAAHGDRDDELPGANAKTVAETVATPIEEQVNGVENMLYMSSQSTNTER